MLISRCLMFCLVNNKKRQAVKTLVVEAQEDVYKRQLQEIQEKDEKLMCFQEQEERLQQLEKELSELLLSLIHI